MSLKFNTDNEESEDLLSAALHVEAADNEDDDDRPPQDGMAYLRQVIKVNYYVQCFSYFCMWDCRLLLIFSYSSLSPHAL